jgi:hypothetical protein
MLSFRPPQHRADAPIVYIHPKDSAWDTDRYEAEVEQMKEAGENPADHPLGQYLGGHTRYDLDAPSKVLGAETSARAYLKPDSAPTKFYLRRLSPADYYELRGTWEIELQRQTMRPRQSYYKAAINGLDKIENGPELEGGNGRRLTTKDVSALYDSCEGLEDLLLDIGEAVFVASMPLSVAEKKP